jgi:DNA-binding NarL/FixJ family response regulator
VEDNPRYLDELIDWLEEEFGYQYIETARNVDEAKSKLDEKPFDVIVADMRLEGNPGGGFAVLHEKVTERNISSVIIILTANDTVADCRRAFKEGAWDYISKSMKGNVFKELDQSILEAINSFNRRGNDKDEEWIEQNMAELLHSYGGQYIAVINHSVIESAITEGELKQRLQERKLPVFVPTIQKIEAPAKSAPSIADLIREGKSSTLVFLGSLRWDVKEKRANEELRFAVLKTIAAFVNSDGGTLLIGVADDGAVLGLEGDLSLEEGGRLDDLRQTLVELIKHRISAAFLDLIDVAFEHHAGKEVCVVKVKRGAAPVFMKGQQRVEFCVRDGSMIRVIEGKEIGHYIRRHWKK